MCISEQMKRKNTFTYEKTHLSPLYLIKTDHIQRKMAEAIIARYSDDAEFTSLLTTLGMADGEIQMLNLEGFNTVEGIVTTYTDTHELEKLLTNLNKTFGSHSTTPCYFPVTVTRRLLGIHYKYHITANVRNKVIDPTEITPIIANTFAEGYVAWTSKRDRYDIEIETPTFNQDNWILWKKKFTNYCECNILTRNIPIEYILNKNDITPEDMGVITVETSLTPEFISRNATHTSEKFTNDSSLVYTLLENELRDTPGWNHTNTFKTTRDGRAAWKSLLNHYEGK